MRDIKFRAWNGKEMSRPFTLGSIVIYWNNSDMPLAALQSDAFAVMQLTGLHDMNGKEIYEGDIVRCDSAFHNCILEVKHGWHENGMAEEVSGFYLFLADQFEWEITKSDLERGDYEVIGNIYEHSEPLEPAASDSDSEVNR